MSAQEQKEGDRPQAGVGWGEQRGGKELKMTMNIEKVQGGPCQWPQLWRCVGLRIVEAPETEFGTRQIQQDIRHSHKIRKSDCRLSLRPWGHYPGMEETGSFESN